MKTTIRVSTCVLALLASGIASGADPVPRKGNVSGTFGWHYASGKNIEVSKDHIIWGGVVAGPFVGDGGTGLLHGTAAFCTFSGEFMGNAVTHNSGDCVATDADGDKVTLRWKCTKCADGVGDLQFTGGTGKYAGIKGAGGYQENIAGPFDSDAGWSVWKMKYELP